MLKDRRGHRGYIKEPLFAVKPEVQIRVGVDMRGPGSRGRFIPGQKAREDPGRVKKGYPVPDGLGVDSNQLMAPPGDFYIDLPIVGVEHQDGDAPLNKLRIKAPGYLEPIRGRDPVILYPKEPPALPDPVF